MGVFLGLGFIALIIYLHFKFWSWVGEKIGNAIGGAIDAMYDNLREPVERPQSLTCKNNVGPVKIRSIIYSKEDFDQILEDVQRSKSGN